LAKTNDQYINFKCIFDFKYSPMNPHKSMPLLLFTVLLSFFSCLTTVPKGNTSFRPGESWKDSEGNFINAHSAGILYDKGVYYWYGEIKTGKSWKVERVGWDCYRVNAGGVSCYSSEDLYNWKYEGVALAPEVKDSLSDIHISKVIERPKVIFNDKTRKYVMWMHIDSDDYLYARAGVAVSDRPQGPFVYLGSLRPNDQMSRDQTLFKDTDGKAYQLCSSEENATLYINELTDDYLKPTGKFKRTFIGQSREAPAMVKHMGKYFILSSGCTGWDPNQAMSAVSDSIMGNYLLIGNPCLGADADKTYYAQSTFILPVEGKTNSYIALFDRWKKTDLEDSRYIWLPMHFENGKMIIQWKDNWKID
jgi:beta-xylosidase